MEEAARNQEEVVNRIMATKNIVMAVNLKSLVSSNDAVDNLSQVVDMEAALKFGHYEEDINQKSCRAATAATGCSSFVMANVADEDNVAGHRYMASDHTIIVKVVLLAWVLNLHLAVDIVVKEVHTIIG